MENQAPDMEAAAQLARDEAVKSPVTETKPLLTGEQQQLKKEKQQFEQPTGEKAPEIPLAKEPETPLETIKPLDEVSKISEDVLRMARSDAITASERAKSDYFQALGHDEGVVAAEQEWKKAVAEYDSKPKSLLENMLRNRKSFRDTSEGQGLWDNMSKARKRFDDSELGKSFVDAKNKAWMAERAAEEALVKSRKDKTSASSPAAGPISEKTSKTTPVELQPIQPPINIEPSILTETATIPENPSQKSIESAPQPAESATDSGDRAIARFHFSGNQEMIKEYDEIKNKIRLEIENAIKKKTEELGASVSDEDEAGIKNTVYKSHLKNDFEITDEQIDGLYELAGNPAKATLAPRKIELNTTYQLTAELESQIVNSITHKKTVGSVLG